MQENAIPINFQSVATAAKVSKSWLYAHTEIAENIRLLRQKSGKIKRLVNQFSQLQKKEQTILKLKKHNALLKTENQQLKNQLELVYGKLCQTFN